MSRYYKIDTRGKHWLQRVSGVPAWQASDEGRIIYDIITNSIYFANDSLWQAGGKYADIPLSTILLIESDVVITGYNLLENKDDMTVYITKGSGAAIPGEAGGTDKIGGTWTQPNHDHTTSAHNHTQVSHNHNLGAHTHLQVGPTGAVFSWNPEDEGGGSNTCADSGHTHVLSGQTGASADNTSTEAPATNSGGGANTGNGATANTWRPRGRNFTRQQRT